MKVGKTFMFSGAYSNVVREHIRIKADTIEISSTTIEYVNESFNLSTKAWISLD